MAIKSKSNTSSSVVRVKANIVRKGVHAKTKHSNHKTSKNYVKLNRGQG